MLTLIRRVHKILFPVSLLLAVLFSSPLRAAVPVFAPVPALSFTKPFAGADPLPQIVTITNVGAGFNFSVMSFTSTGNWLSVTPGLGCCETTPSPLKATVTTLPTLAVGSYPGSIVVISSDLSTTLTIPLTLTVVDTGSAYLDNLPGAMSFSLKTAGTVVTHQDIQVRDGGPLTLPWTLTTSTADGGAWLTTTLVSGTAPSIITVGVDVTKLPNTGLVAGTFIGQLVFTTAASTTTVPVSIVVGTNILSQVSAINFVKVFGGADPLPQILTIPSTGTALSFTVASSTASGGSWLTVSPGPGCCELTPNPVTATVSTLPTLAVGTYTAQIVVTTSTSSMAITIPVSLTVAPAGPYFDNLPGSMSFSLVTNGTAITSQVLEVRDGGTGSLPWTLSTTTSDAGNWLSVLSPTSGVAPSLVTVGVNVANLPNAGLIAGTFIGELVFDSATGRITVPVSVVVGANIFNEVPAIDFTKVFGGANPLPQTLSISSTGTAFSYSVTSSTATGGTWLTVSPGPGCCELTPGTITATVNASPTLAVGTYTAQIVATSSTGSMSITIPVTLTVASAALPFFDNVPGQMSFSFTTAAAYIAPPQVIQIRNAGAGTLTWTLATSTSDGGSWLNASLLAGTAPSTVSISVQKGSLPGLGLLAGTFIGELVFRTPGSTVTVSVSVTIGANVLSQVNAINFIKVFGGANPLPQTLTVPSTGTNLSFSVTSSTATGGAWLSVTPGPGCCELTPNTITATVNASPTLAVGTYTAQIVVTTSTSSQAITIPVTLTVESAGGTFFDNVPGQMSFFIPTSTGNPVPQDVLLQNGGVGTLNWTVTTSTSDGGNWLTASIPVGVTPATVTIGVITSALPNAGLIAGTFVGELAFDGVGGRVTIPVSVVVGAAIFVNPPAINGVVTAAAAGGAVFIDKVFGAANPVPVTVGIASTGTNFSYFVNSATANGGAWMNVTPGVGCCEVTPTSVTVTIVAAPTLPVGIYTGQFVTTTSTGSNAMTIPVILSVSPATAAVPSAEAVLRDSTGAIQLDVFPSTTLVNSGGSFASDPSIGEDLNGNAFVTARDSSNATWTNVFNPVTSTFAGWQFGGGSTVGVPATAVAPSGTAWIAARDSFGSYWLVNYVSGTGYGTWIPLQGAFTTDPAIAACGDGSLYVVGKDASNSMWSGRYIPGLGFQNFFPGGASIQGKPSATCGSDNAVYVLGRDFSNSNWMVRVSGNTWGTWFPGGAQATADPGVIPLGGALGEVILGPGGGAYRNGFAEGTTNGWGAWTPLGGNFSTISPAAVGSQNFFIGVSAVNGGLFWWQQHGNKFTGIGNNGVAVGALAAAPH